MPNLRAKYGQIPPGDLPTHQHSGADITSGTVAPDRLGSGSPASSKFLDGSSNWRELLDSDLPAGLSAGSGYGQVDSGAFALGLYGYGIAGVNDQPGITCGGTTAGGSVIYNCPSAKTHNFLVNGALNMCIGSALGSTVDGNWVIGKYGNPSAIGSVTGVCGSGSSIYYNAPTGGGHSIRINNTVVALVQSALISLSAPVTLGNSYTATAGSNQIVGTASGVQINAPTGSTVAISTNGTTRASFGLNGLVFASGLTTAASGDISIGSQWPTTMTLNVPTGGLYLFGEAGTSGVVISAASKYLQFQAAGGILGAAGNAGNCYLAGGNVAANTSCAYIRVYGVSDAYNAGQALYACGNVAGAKHSFFDSSGTERLKIDETAITALGPLITPTATPASATAAGVAGQWAWDASYIYICTSTNTWRRVEHNTW